MKKYFRGLFAYVAKKLGYQDVLYPLAPMTVIYKTFDANELKYTLKVTSDIPENEIRSVILDRLFEDVARCIHLSFQRTGNFEGTCTGRLYIGKER